MQTISTGPSTERILRAALVMVLVDVFTVLFAYDGFIGYAQKNATELARLLGLPAGEAPAFDENMTAARGQAVAQGLRAGEGIDAVKQQLGQPSAEKDGSLYYLGRGGWLRVDTDAGRVRAAQWQNAAHTETDQQWQRWIAYALGVMGLIVTFNFARVISDRLVLSKEGLKLFGRPAIEWDAITALRQGPGAGGSIEVEYRSDGMSQCLRFDDYRFKHLAAISAAIASQKGWDDPVAAN